MKGRKVIVSMCKFRKTKLQMTLVNKKVFRQTQTPLNCLLLEGKVYRAERKRSHSMDVKENFCTPIV